MESKLPVSDVMDRNKYIFMIYFLIGIVMKLLGIYFLLL